MTQRSGVSDEAAKLLGALERWLRTAAESSATSGASAGSEGNRGVGVVRDLFANSEQSHQNHESSCEICPLCRVIAAARAARPDIVEHLVDAAGSVLLALRAWSEPGADTSSSPAEEPAEPSAIVVQHITVN
ncbi:MAG: hypothetical protein ABIM89_07085 [Mycobacteriales bacterium]